MTLGIQEKQQLEAERHSEQASAPDEVIEQELTELIETERAHVHEHGLHLSKETVLRMLQLLSQRQDLCDNDRTVLRQMVNDLNNELYDSKYAQAFTYLCFTV